MRAFVCTDAAWGWAWRDFWQVVFCDAFSCSSLSSSWFGRKFTFGRVFVAVVVSFPSRVGCMCELWEEAR